MMKCKKGEMYNIFQKIEILFKQNIKGNLQSKKEKSKKKQKSKKSKKAKMEFNKKMKVYIPLMNSAWANEDKIKQVFNMRMLGDVKKVQIIKKRSTKKETGYVHSAIVELDWYETRTAFDMQQKMNVGGVVTDSKLMLDDKWYFLLLNGNTRFWKNK